MSQLVQKHSEMPDMKVRIAGLSCPSCKGSRVALNVWKQQKPMGRLRDDVGDVDLWARSLTTDFLVVWWHGRRNPTHLYMLPTLLWEPSKLLKPIFPCSYRGFSRTDHTFVTAQKQILQFSFLPQPCTFFLECPWNSRSSVRRTHPNGGYSGWWLVGQERKEGSLLSKCHLQHWLPTLSWSHSSMRVTVWPKITIFQHQCGIHS